MTPCPTRQDWIRCIDGEATRNEETAFAMHSTSCGACRSERAAVADLRAQLGRSIATTPSVEEIDALMALAEKAMPAARPRRAPRALAWSMGAAAAAASIAIGFVATRPPDLVARGSGAPASPQPVSLARRVGVDFWLRSAKQPLVSGSTLQRTAPLLLSYRNRETAPVYLLAFGIDAERELHWLAPVYLDAAGEAPRSLLLAATPEAFTTDGVEWSELPRGPLQLVSMVGATQLSVAALEAIPPAERNLAALQRRFPAFQLDAITLEVE